MVLRISFSLGPAAKGVSGHVRDTLHHSFKKLSNELMMELTRLADVDGPTTSVGGRDSENRMLAGTCPEPDPFSAEYRRIDGQVYSCSSLKSLPYPPKTFPGMAYE